MNVGLYEHSKNLKKKKFKNRKSWIKNLADMCIYACCVLIYNCFLVFRFIFLKFRRGKWCWIFLNTFNISKMLYKVEGKKLVVDSVSTILTLWDLWFEECVMDSHLPVFFFYVKGGWIWEVSSYYWKKNPKFQNAWTWNDGSNAICVWADWWLYIKQECNSREKYNLGTTWPIFIHC